MFVMYCMQCYVCNCDMFSVVNVYHDYFTFCVVCIHGRRYVCCSKCNVVSDECNAPTSCIVQPIGMHGDEVMYFVCVCFKGDLGFLNCCDICVVNKQFERLEFVFDFVYVNLQYDGISLTFTAGLCPCVVSVVMWSTVVKLCTVGVLTLEVSLVS